MEWRKFARIGTHMKPRKSKTCLSIVEMSCKNATAYKRFRTPQLEPILKELLCFPRLCFNLNLENENEDVYS